MAFRLVWTEPTSKAAEYLNFPASLLVEQLDLRMGGCFGEIQIEETAQSFPLVFQVARRFIDQRIALVGDAAHRVHPLAGQGLNLGMRDVATLAEIIMDQARLGLDFGGADSLQNYERRRRFDATANAAAFDLLHKSYAMPGNAAQAVRRSGMNLMNGTGALKSALHREAAGIAGDIPSLFQ
jgi:2-octaprenyl-6-methoxyphenol hydroxylase